MGTAMTKAHGSEGHLEKDCFVCGDFKKGKRLGSGAFSTVYLGRKKTDSELYAIKVIKKAGLSDEDKQGLKQEIAILKELKSDLVMKLYAVYDNKKTYQLVTELVEGGEISEEVAAV